MSSDLLNYIIPKEKWARRITLACIPLTLGLYLTRYYIESSREAEMKRQMEMTKAILESENEKKKSILSRKNKKYEGILREQVGDDFSKKEEKRFEEERDIFEIAKIRKKEK